MKGRSQNTQTSSAVNFAAGGIDPREATQLSVIEANSEQI